MPNAVVGCEFWLYNDDCFVGHLESLQTKEYLALAWFLAMCRNCKERLVILVPDLLVVYFFIPIIFYTNYNTYLQPFSENEQQRIFEIIKTELADHQLFYEEFESSVDNG